MRKRLLAECLQRFFKPVCLFPRWEGRGASQYDSPKKEECKWYSFLSLFSWLTLASLLACSKPSDSRARRSDGGKPVLKSYLGKTRGKKSPLVFFSLIFRPRSTNRMPGTSYESVNKPFKGYFVVQCYFLFRDIVLCDNEIRGSASVSRPRISAYEAQPKKLTHYVLSRTKYVILKNYGDRGGCYPSRP